MKLKKLKITTWIGAATSCYVILDEKSKEVMVIDPAGDVPKIKETIEILDGKLKYIYLTHCHSDHILGAEELRNIMGGKILIHRFEAENLNNPDVNLIPQMMGREDIALEQDSRVDDNDIIHLGNLQFKVIHTPGHTSGSTCIYCEEQGCLFSGDTIFKGTWGRTDLPTSSMEDIMNSIEKKLLVLPEETMIYPGHGLSSKIKDEKSLYFDLTLNDY